MPLHAQMEQKQRLTNLEKFASSETGLLIATDVAARGLDIPNIKHIIHYQVPRSTEVKTRLNALSVDQSSLLALHSSEWTNSSC